MVFDYEGLSLDKGDVYKTLCQRYNGGSEMDVQLIESVEKIAQGQKMTLYTFEGMDGFFEFYLYPNGSWKVIES
jgi:hypothetical protein